MPVYYDHKLVHVHVPKTAGTAIGNLFHPDGDLPWGKEYWYGSDQQEDRWYEYQHVTVPELYRLANRNFGQFKSFAVVRDPYTRLISEFRWRKKVGEQYPSPHIAEFLSFDEFLDAIPQDMDKNWDAYIAGGSRLLANFLIHVRPQHHYVFDRMHCLLVDNILCYENLQRDITLFLEPYDISTAPIVSTAIHQVEENFTRGQLDLVNRIYELDFELLRFPMA